MTKMTLTKRGGFRVAVLAAIFLLSFSSLPAQVLIKGKITDKNGAGLIGASIALQDTRFGGFTDLDGNYSFEAVVDPGPYVLVVTSVGYRTVSMNISITGNQVEQNFQVEEDILSLDEVVVTGTVANTAKKELGNSISSLSSKDLANANAVSIDGALQGKISGAQVTQNSGNPAGGITVRLRGPSTIVGSSDPLFIVDGVIVNNDSRQLIDLGGYAQNRLVDINPNDIERIEIIKGAAAAAIYGSRANNGVVQIFTKKGVEGAARVSFSTQIRLNQLRKKLEFNEYPFAFNNTTASDLTQRPVERYDYQDLIFRDGIGTENSLSVSGGTANTKYYVSGSNLYNQGIVDETDFSRNGLRIRLSQKVGKIVSVDAGANYVVSSSREIPNGGLVEAYGALTGFIFANNFINPEPDPATGIYPSTAPTNVLRRTNPLEAIERFDFRQQTNRFIGDVQVNIKPILGLNIDYVVGMDNYTQIATAYIPPKNTTPSYDGGFSRRADATVFQINNDLNISYRTDLSDWLKSTTGLGATLQYDRTNTFSAQALQLGAFGETVNNGTIVAGEFRSERTIMGAFAQQSFGIHDLLFLTGAARVDASSVYGEDNRWQFFPKLSGSLVASNLGFWKDSGLGKLFPNFKIRAAWGQSGNLTAIGVYDRFTNYGPIVYGGQTGYLAPQQLGNFTVVPERQTEFEVGADLTMLNDRLSLEFTYYNKDVKDLILNRTLSPTTGFNNRLINVGTMTNKGFEFMVKAVPVNTSQFQWVTTFNYTSNDNVVNGVEGNGVLPFAGGFSQVAAVNGYPLGAFYTGFAATNPDGTYLLTTGGLPQRERGVQGPNGTYTVGRDANGQPSGTPLVKVVGDPNPVHVVAWVNEVSMNKLTFRMQWDGMLGFDVFNFTKRVGDRDLYGGLKGYEAELKGEVPKGTSAALFGILGEWIEDGSFIKLREISVSYDLPTKGLLRGLRITAAGRNLLSIDDYSGYDPEVNAAGQDNAVRGFDFVEVPIPRMFILGLNANF